MHIVDNKLVGTIVSDVYSENGSVIIVLSDGDTTPVREMQTYSYIQTKELAEIGIAINPKGVVTIPGYTLEEFNNELDPNLYAITVKYNGELYQIGLADFIELEVGEDVEYVPYEEGAYPGQTVGAVIPPFSGENAKQVVSVNEETGKLEWRDETEELPFINSGDGGKVLTVKDDATGVEWKDVPDELPTIASGDAGKVLKVNSGATGTEWGDIPEGLPTIESGDAGKVLKVNAGETGAEWGDIPDELPSVTGNAGKVLKVNAGETGTEWGSVSKIYNNHIGSNTTGWKFHCEAITSKRIDTYADFAGFLYGMNAISIAQAYVAIGLDPDNKQVIGVYSGNGTEITVVLFDGTNVTTVNRPGLTFRGVALN